MAIKLYFNPQSRATIARWALDEVRAPYEIVHVDLAGREHKGAAYKAINPAGKLPALVDGDTTVFENVAIGLYLADRFPAANLAPPPGAPERGRYLSLMVYATSQLEPAMGDALLKLPYHPQRGWTEWSDVQDVLAAELGAGPYLFGDRFSMADVMIGAMLIWRRRFGGDERPALAAYVDRLLARETSTAMRGG